MPHLTPESEMPFGRHRGKKMKEIPKTYFEQLRRNLCGTRAYGAMKEVLLYHSEYNTK